MRELANMIGFDVAAPVVIIAILVFIFTAATSTVAAGCFVLGRKRPAAPKPP